MGVRDIMPWGRPHNQAPTGFREAEQSPFLALHRDVNRLFDDLFHGFDLPMPAGRPSHWAGGWPSMEMSETDREVRIAAEVPGLDEKDVEVLLQDGVLTLRGEKRAETEDKDRQFTERLYGRFERRIAVGEVDEDRVKATFKNGVLTVTLPKTERAAAAARRIAINER
ncbi:Hsp20/alpha crystallin family protein [Phreatobacter stygius]|uniref:Hsp20/alpha crystallin family protein n=1 Tax=Phreatobacter stygius TaxID=1940610 RepID=A0A4D7BI33_9HYPH|nr:Hsp20/alpha crystallin family protein [Phreatobacter stygius]QCI67467.1 Hsp20/alpha crystallin family protein [Phreatobacter stygius]